MSNDEIEALKKALDESVKLQSHYASLLNQYDGGKRMTFKDGAAWQARLKELDCACTPAPKPRNHCNMHDDCRAAEAEAAAKGKPERYGIGSVRLEHCTDEGCEDCFGS